MQSQTTSAQGFPKAPRVTDESRPRILVVEDDPSLSAGLIAALASHGYKAEQSVSGISALSRVAESEFDLLMLDIGLPGIDGFEILRRLRNEGRGVPVLILTARDDVGDRIHGLDLGADDYMAKPFALPELAARVRALLRRGQSARGLRIMHGPLAIDVAARRASLYGTSLELTAREWAVLRILLAKVTRLVSKEAIIKSLTNWDEDLSSNAIEVHISRLRAKLEPGGIRIRTVRGFGYMLEEFQPSSA